MDSDWELIEVPEIIQIQQIYVGELYMHPDLNSNPDWKCHGYDGKLLPRGCLTDTIDANYSKVVGWSSKAD